MKKIYILTIMLMYSFAMIISTSCNKEYIASDQELNVIEPDDEPDDPENEDSGIITPENELISHASDIYNKLNDTLLKFGTVAHKSFVYTCAKKLGLPESRAIIMRNASVMPDEYQSGIDNSFNQQWSHAYMVIKTLWGMQWVWGDADDDFHDNLLGDSGESESPEGYNGKWAGYYYILGNRDLGDWYVGYACHYITDVSFVLHSTFPNVNMLLHHFDFETWMDNNWDQGHNFSQVLSNVPIESYYTITDPKAAIRNAVIASNYSYNTNAQKAWDNFEESDFPTSTGSGNDDCVYYTKLMIEEATKWTGGAIRYALIRYDQW